MQTPQQQPMSTYGSSQPAAPHVATGGSHYGPYGSATATPSQQMPSSHHSYGMGQQQSAAQPVVQASHVAHTPMPYATQQQTQPAVVNQQQQQQQAYLQAQYAQQYYAHHVGNPRSHANVHGRK